MTDPNRSRQPLVIDRTWLRRFGCWFKCGGQIERSDFSARRSRCRRGCGRGGVGTGGRRAERIGRAAVCGVAQRGRMLFGCAGGGVASSSAVCMCGDSSGRLLRIRVGTHGGLQRQAVDAMAMSDQSDCDCRESRRRRRPLSTRPRCRGERHERSGRQSPHTQTAPNPNVQSFASLPPSLPAPLSVASRQGESTKKFGPNIRHVRMQPFQAQTC